jgi:hypothetical protein
MPNWRFPCACKESASLSRGSCEALEVRVISLQDQAWSELRHAYGPATDVPPLLEAIEQDPSRSDPRDGPWSKLWSALYHQGDIYPASFAAVPHVVKIVGSAPHHACFDFFLFPASVEVARNRLGVKVPDALIRSYRESLQLLPGIAAAAADRDWNGPLGRSIVAAVAAAKEQFSAAELLLEIEEADDSEVLEWYQSRERSGT